MPKIHNTSQGEMWDMISLLYYDSEMHMDKLITANISFRNIVVFPANCKIIIPDLENKKVSPFPLGEINNEFKTSKSRNII